MINSVINLFQNNKDKENNKDKNSSIYKNLKSRSEIKTDIGKHFCSIFWCEEHLGLNINEPIVAKSNNLKDLIPQNSSDNIARYKNINNKTSTNCSSCSIF